MGKFFYNSLNLPEPLSAEDEKDALTRLKVHNDQSAKDLLVEHNLRLVLHIVKGFLNTGVDGDDLFEIGTIGLMKGIDTFHIEKEIKLATYTSRCITNEILMYLCKFNKDSYYMMSIEEPVSTDHDGNELTINEFLSDPKDEEAIYQLEAIEYASAILSISLYSLPTNRLIIILYTLSEMITQREIGERMSLSQSYISRIQKAYRKEAKEIREFSDENLKLKYSLSQSDDLNFVFFIDNRRRFCLSIHSDFLNPFIAFMATHDNEFEIADDTGRIIIRLRFDESSYLFCAELIQYLSENISKLSNINIWDFL